MSKQSRGRAQARTRRNKIRHATQEAKRDRLVQREVMVEFLLEIDWIEAAADVQLGRVSPARARRWLEDHGVIEVSR